MIAKILLEVPETPAVALAINSSAFALISLDPPDEDVEAVDFSDCACSF